MTQGERNVRHASSDELTTAIKECQYSTVLQHKLAKGYVLVSFLFSNPVCDLMIKKYIFGITYNLCY